MATTLSTASSWYYDRDSTTLYINEDQHLVGINQEFPRYDLDVNGTVYAETYCNLPAFAMSNDIYPKAIFGSNVATYGSNTATYASNNMVVNGNVVTVSNLNVLSTIQRNGSNIVGTNGKIDYVKWLSNCPSYSNNDSMDIAGIVLGSLGIVAAAGGQILNGTGGMGDRLFNDVMNKTGGDSTESDYDPFSSDSNLLVHWNSITYPPIYTNRGISEVGFNSNTYHSGKSKLVKLLHSSFMDTDGGRIRRMNTGVGRTKTIFDFETEQLFCETVKTTSNIESSNLISSNLMTNNITACNVVLLSNLQVPSINAYDTITNTFSANQVRVGEFYVRNDGIWFGNPANPFTSTAIIDATGAYVGLVNKEQIRNLEGFSLQSAADGLLEWSSFQSTTMPSYFDPFVTTTGNPLFEV